MLTVWMTKPTSFHKQSYSFDAYIGRQEYPTIRTEEGCSTGTVHKILPLSRIVSLGRSNALSATELN